MQGKRTVDPGAVLMEFEGLTLGDRRLDSRARDIVAAVAGSPAESFPRQERSVAGREGLYRFFSNGRVSMEKLLEGHVTSTLGRIDGRRVVRLLHDSSSFRFAGDREGLGVVLGDTMGFMGHFTLALAADETREPLGVLAVSTSVRSDAISHRGLSLSARNRISKAKPRAERESSRWERQARSTADLIPTGTRAIHIMDQEADDFVLLGEMQRAGLDFVVRVSPKRKTTEGLLDAKTVLGQKPSTVFRSVQLTMRPKSKRRILSRTRTARLERDAHLEVRWGVVNIPRSSYSDSDLSELSLNAVHVLEPRPPEGEQAIEWMLFTSETVHTLEDATAVIDHYRARWVIEEYFKALKTGCAFEKRQLTSYSGLTRALGLFVPIAWHLLALRHLARIDPSRKVSSVFDTEQLFLLSSLLKRQKYTLPESPSVRQAMLGIAALGGHIVNNGEPGWLVLGRGYTYFLEAEAVWLLARRSDQS